MDGVAAPPREAARPVRRLPRWASPWLHFAALALALAAVIAISLVGYGIHNGDITEYHAYAVAFWQGTPRFFALPLEYPPLSIAVFSLTLLPPLANAQLVFMAWMALFVLAGYGLVLRFSGWRSALLSAAYLLLGTAGVLLAHYDIVPVLTTLGALWCLRRRRFGGAYALLAVGTLLKLYPAFLVPIVVIEQGQIISGGRAAGFARDLLRREGLPSLLRGVGLFSGIVAAGIVAALAVNRTAALSFLSYAGQRPLQLESTPASLLWVGTLFGSPAYPNHSFASYNYVGALDGVLELASAAALALGCLWVYWRQARGRLTAARAMLACICVVVATNKIFSPQYLIWLVPLVAIIEGFDVLWVVICALTTVIFPVLYRLHPLGLAPYSWQFMLVVAVRNGLLIVVTLRAILRRDEAFAPPSLSSAAATPAPAVSS